MVGLPVSDMWSPERWAATFGTSSTQKSHQWKPREWHTGMKLPEGGCGFLYDRPPFIGVL